MLEMKNIYNIENKICEKIEKLKAKHEAITYFINDNIYLVMIEVLEDVLRLINEEIVNENVSDYFNNNRVKNGRCFYGITDFMTATKLVAD